MNNMVFVGLDVHKATIAVALAEGGACPHSHGAFPVKRHLFTAHAKFRHWIRPYPINADG